MAMIDMSIPVSRIVCTRGFCWQTVTIQDPFSLTSCFVLCIYVLSDLLDVLFYL